VVKMAFLTKTRKKIPYEVRIKELIQLVNQKGQIQLDELVKKWMLDPAYIKRLIRMAMVKYSYLVYDDSLEILKIEKEKR